jgi:hypothetical protein
MGHENFKKFFTMLENMNGWNLMYQPERSSIQRHPLSPKDKRKRSQHPDPPGSHRGEMSKQKNSKNPHENCWKESVGDKQDKVYKQEDQKSATKTPNQILNYVFNFLTGSNSK